MDTDGNNTDTNTGGSFMGGHGGSLRLECFTDVNYAMTLNGIDTCTLCELTNGDATDWHDVRIGVGGQYVGSSETVLSCVAAGQTAQVALDIKPDISELLNLTESVRTEFTVEVSLTKTATAAADQLPTANPKESTADDYELIFRQSYPIRLMAYDQWNGAATRPELLASFVTPNDPALNSVVLRATKALDELTGNPSMDAYQSGDPNRVRAQVAAIFKALRQEGITYAVAPASFEQSGQRIRMAGAVLSGKLGNCLDTTLLFASCLESVGLLPLVVLTEGHAFVGAWLVPDELGQNADDDPAFLLKKCADGVSEMVLVETTAITQSRQADFEDAVRTATAQLRDEGKFLMAIDIHRCRTYAGIRPLPQRTADAAGRWTVAAADTPRHNADIGTVDRLDRYALNLDASASKTLTRQMIWERKLLDFSLRNNLINTRLGKRVIPFVSFDIESIEDYISDGDSIEIRPFPNGGEPKPADKGIYDSAKQAPEMHDLVVEELKQKRLLSYLSEADLNTALKFIYRTARTAVEENGANSLFLALGFMRWYESERSMQPRYAPLLLVPVDIVRRMGGKGYIIRARDEDTLLNVTLAELLKQQFSIEMTAALTPLPQDEHGVDVKQVFAVARHCIANMKRWNVLEESMLGLFSFSKFVMWNDIHANAMKLKQNAIVASLLENRLMWHDDGDPVDARELDRSIKPQRYAIPLDVDSSQMEAVIDSGDGKSFILHGPPGTGKSQTITNIIANALYQGKRVLFVAEKMAALEVVQRRLAKIGLDPFCLELHSNKANKQHFLGQLQTALDVAHSKTPDEYESTANRLFEARQKLIKTLDAIHTRRASGLSLYDCIARFTAISHEEITSGLPPSAGVTADKIAAWREQIVELDTVFSLCGHPADSRLSGLEPLDAMPELMNRLREQLAIFRETFVKVKAAVEQLSAVLFGIPTDDSRDDLHTVVQLAQLLQQTPIISRRLLELQADDGFKRNMTEAVSAGRKRDMLRTKLLSQNDEGILNIDTARLQREWAAVSRKWFLARILGQRKFLNAMRQYNPSMQAADVDDVLSAVAEYQSSRGAVGNHSAMLEEAFTAYGQAGQENWTKIEQAYAIAPSVEALLERFAKRHGLRPTQLAATFTAAVGDDVAAFRQDYGTELKSLQADYAALQQAEGNIATFARMYLPEEHISTSVPQTLDGWLAAFGGIRDWSQWTSRKHRLEDEGLQCVCRYIENGHKNGRDAAQALLKGLYRQLATDTINGDTQLAMFSGVLHDSLIGRYRELTAGFQKLTRQELFCRLAANIPSQTMEATASSEMGILKRNIKNHGRGTSIRHIIDQIPALLPRLCPCMLMSPISVAQYIDLAAPPFDIVVFDEASQMPTSEAVGAIARGRALVCVGDPMQMPPTSFFTSSSVDDDEAGVDDMESILDDCITLSIPSRYLTWHYRSKHESLIAFSNREYYDGRLYTFPSADDRVSKVNLVQIEGTYDKGRTRSNPDEARAIVQEVIRRLSDPELSRRSIGIVAFSKVQQSLIEDMLDDELAKRPDLETLATQGDEPLFVKNLENVQGDERDVILFSVGYGPDRNGHVSMNFGPLNNQGGERRLNVAVSRARYEMTVFSTLRADQIDLRRSNAKGVTGLKKFLEFAQRGVSALPAAAASAATLEVSPMMADLKQELERRGWKADSMVGRSEFRVDLAVVDPENPDLYVLGILSDGGSYYNTKTTRDRDICQPNVLGMLGWRVVRLWTVDWFLNREAAMQRILKSIEEAVAAKHKAATATISEPAAGNRPTASASASSAASASGNKPSASEPAAKAASASGQSASSSARGSAQKPSMLIQGNHEAASNVAAAGRPDKKKEPERTSALINDRECNYTFAQIRSVLKPRPLAQVLDDPERMQGQISKIVEKEQPVTNTYIYKRIAALNMLPRVSSKLQAAVDSLLAAGGYYLDPLSDGLQMVYWHDSASARGYRLYRVNSRRDIADIPVIELMNAAVYAVEQQISMPREDLMKVTASLLGIKRRSQAMEAATARALDLLVSQGILAERDGRVSLGR